MRNSYEFQEVIQIGEAQSLVLGAKRVGMLDTRTGDEWTDYFVVADIDE